MNTDLLPTTKTPALTSKRIFKTWLPLVASWLLMSVELPAINAVVARLSNPEINLAAYGGVVFPIALTIEAPVIMLLAASTALSRDWPSYKRLRRMTLLMGAGLTAVHLLVALTPVYDFIVTVLLQSPAEVIEPARLGLVFLAPWTFAIAYRRFQQGAMIRYGHSGMVGQTTFVRLVTVSAVIAVGYFVKTIPGTALAGFAQGLGVTAEAVYAGIRVRKILPAIKASPPAKRPLTLRRFIGFYAPLAITSSIWLLWQPLISGSVSRMPNPLESLTTWSVISGILFIFRSPGVAFNETVVALLEETRAYHRLKKFAGFAALAVFLLAVLFVLTPLAVWWLRYIANLTPDLTVIGRTALALGMPVGFLSVYISLYQGIIVNQEKTRAVAEAVSLFLLALGSVLLAGILTQAYRGVYVAAAAFSVAHLVQGAWLMWRSRKQRRLLLQNS